MTAEVKNIAIVGAGISGLLTAYLLKVERDQPEVSITIFEKSDRIGGNAHTVRFDLGEPSTNVLERWADLGVNDFNLSSYTHINQLFTELGVQTLLLEDSTAFSNLDGSVSYVIEADYKGLDCDADNRYTNMPKEVKRGFDNFKRQAPKDLGDPKYFQFSVADYIADRNQNPPEGYDSTRGDFYPDEFVNYNLYPRINGMYFVHDTIPSTMSFRGIMSYYALQEGFGKKKRPKRVYIVGGTQTWINKLKEKLEEKGVSIVCNATVEVYGNSEGNPQLAVTRDDEPNINDEKYQDFDAIVLACHASNSLKMIKGGITQEMVSTLCQFDYYNSVAVAHTYSPLLPPDRNAWRTYNILIHGDAAQLRPYTISYVCNRHQNDANSNLYNEFGKPEFFVTIDPPKPIPAQYVLKQKQKDNNGNFLPAIATFAHNIVSVETMRAQDQLWGINDYHETIQGQNGLYFTGGWTVGAGLHEECYISACRVVKLLQGEGLDRSEFYTPHSDQTSIEKIGGVQAAARTSDASNYAPNYIRKAINSGESSED